MRGPSFHRHASRVGYQGRVDQTLLPACHVGAPPLVLCEKGKPAVRRGRKTTGLLREMAGLPNRHRGNLSKLPWGKEIEDAFSFLQYPLGSSYRRRSSSKSR